MSKPEKLTVVVEPETRQALTAWAKEVDRPIANLLRQIVHHSLEQRRQGQQQEGIAA
jgi:cell division protein ZapA (FtsZ GTPase activity inhibitor)